MKPFLDFLAGLGRVFVRLLAIIVPICLAFYCIDILKISSVTDKPTQIELLAAVLVLSLVVGFAVQRLVQPLIRSFGTAPAAQAVHTNDEEEVRDRLAISVVSTGAAAIAGLAALLLILIGHYDKGDNGKDITTTGMNVFTTVLPVLATWVGTVLAFYFTKESFRQAAQSTQALLGGQDAASSLITESPGVMIAYDKITKVELTTAQVAAAGSNTAAALARTDLLDQLFSATASRVVVFGPDRSPLYVIRQKRATPGLTVGAYLQVPANAQDAGRMHAVNQQATLADGQRVLKLYNVADIFVTQNGTIAEPALGWVPDDHLR